MLPLYVRDVALILRSPHFKTGCFIWALLARIKCNAFLYLNLITERLECVVQIDWLGLILSRLNAWIHLMDAALEIVLLIFHKVLEVDVCLMPEHRFVIYLKVLHYAGA